jgi:hypothetical protein
MIVCGEIPTNVAAVVGYSDWEGVAKSRAMTVASNGAGTVGPVAVWSAPLMPGKYDIVVDVNGNGKYDSGIDALDSDDVQITGGFLVIPEYPMGAIVGLAGCLAAFGAFRVTKRRAF